VSLSSLSLSARPAPVTRTTVTSACILLGALVCVGVFAGALAYSTKLGVIILLAICFIPLAVTRLQLAICGWMVLVFLASTTTFGSMPNRVLLFVGLCWIGLLVGRRIRRGNVLGDDYRIIVLVVVFISWVVLSLAWAPAPGTTSVQVKQLLYGGFSVILLLGAVVERRHVRWVATAFVAGAAVSVLWGAAKGGLSLSTGAGSEVADSAGRFQGGAGDPNYLAAVLVPAIMLAGGLAAVRRAPFLRALLVPATVIIAVGLAATQSRGGLIAAGVCAVVALAIWPGRRALIGTLIAFAVGSTAAFFLVNPAAWSRILESNQGSGRVDIWQVAWRIVHDHPFFGVGFGQFPQVSPHYVLQPGALKYISLIVEKQIVVHNLYLELWVEEGIIGLLLFGLLAGGSLISGWLAVRSFDAQRDIEMAALARASILALVGMLTATFFLSDLENGQLWILLALGPVLAALARRQAGHLRVAPDSDIAPERSPPTLPGLKARRSIPLR
jgi:O-antigen ligase